MIGMNTISAFVRGHPALTYFALVILISWGGGAVVVGPAHLPLNSSMRAPDAFLFLSILGAGIAGPQT